MGQYVFSYYEGFQFRRSYSINWCFPRYILNSVCHVSFFAFTVHPSSGVLISTAASLVALWVTTVTVFGVVTVVLSWQIFKLKQMGMLGHMNDIDMIIIVNVSTRS